MSRNKRNNETEEHFDVDTSTAHVFTYVGQGEDPPRKINFMGRQEFVRGRATEVVDELVLDRISKNPCFVEGEVDMEDLHKQDEAAALKADARRKEDAHVNMAFRKKHGMTGEAA